jgi:hypothetical protein
MPNGRSSTAKPPAHAAPDTPSEEFTANEAQNKSIAAISGASKASGRGIKTPTGPAKHQELQHQLVNPVRNRGRQSSDPDLAEFKRPGSDANLKRWEQTEAGKKLVRESGGEVDEEVSDEFEANEEARQEG